MSNVTNVLRFACRVPSCSLHLWRSILCTFSILLLLNCAQITDNKYNKFTSDNKYIKIKKSALYTVSIRSTTTVRSGVLGGRVQYRAAGGQRAASERERARASERKGAPCLFSFCFFLRLHFALDRNGVLATGGSHPPLPLAYMPTRSCHEPRGLLTFL